MKIHLSRFFLTLAALLALAIGAGAEERVVNVYNWSDYVDPKVIEDFTKETGIKVVYDTYDSNETLETRMLAGKTGYDVVVPSGTFLQRQIQAGLYQKLDKTKLPHAAGLWPEILARLAVYDPGNQYAVPYMWFTTGIAYNADKVKERLGEAPVNSWEMIFKPEILKKFADCGVYVIDSPEDLFAIALNYLRLDPNSKRRDDLLRATELLRVMRRNVKKFHSSEYINALANGDICLAVGWSGDAALARSRAREADNGLGIGYVVPKEGSVIALDNMAIPANAPHPAAAYALINFLLRPDIAARNTAATGFANGLTAPLLASDKGNPTSADPAATLYAVRAYPAAVQKFIEREWTQITK